uniref:Uncharacterized protein n=1 Tax=Romanomermis culicivorax TaxID=13658 RepID=A0A915KGR4_ROMCU
MSIRCGEQDKSLSLYDDLNKHLLQADILADRNLKQLNEFVELCKDVDPEFLTPEVRDELFGACKKMVTSQSKNRQLQDSVREIKNFIRSKETVDVIEKEELLEIVENSMASNISHPEQNQAFKDLKYALRHVGE